MASDGTKRGRGRPTDLTPEIQEAFCAAIEKGVPIRHACAAAGIHESTYFRWLSRADEDEKKDVSGSPYIDFREAIARAENTLLQERLSRLNAMADEVNLKTGQRDPRIDMWFLERRFPSEFGNRTKTELSGPDGGPVVMTLADIVRSAREAEEKEKAQAEEKNG